MRKIKILLGIILLSSVVACGNNKPKFELKKDKFVFEFGEEILLSPEDVLKTENENLIQNTQLAADIDDEKMVREELSDMVTYVIIENSIQIDGLPVGEYRGTAEYEDETLDFKIIVKDTTAPEFIDFQDKIEVEQNSTEDLTTKFKIEDLSEATVSLDMAKVDLAKAGEYKTTVTAKDAYDNETVKDITIIVKEKATAEETNAETNEESTTSGTVDSSGAGTTGDSTNTSGGTGSTSTGGITTTPSNPTPAPSEPIVQLTPTPLGGQIFDTDTAAADWADSIFNDWDAARKYAAKFGYSDITSYITTQIAYGYTSTGEIVNVKYSVTWTFQ
ncbi:hypothetical protein [Breznakia pachnodae]|uniref:Uncharacterized protein n=1 Tax=Breznakia pachnodae TaxID=265178 RepID=A0ABU0E704_9FIRM|nr:hypothetical protein [Breznakia pachnodae]MDQ0362483.1 hypothetical protein [Breznakia pachnodae]